MDGLKVKTLGASSFRKSLEALVHEQHVQAASRQRKVAAKSSQQLKRTQPLYRCCSNSSFRGRQFSLSPMKRNGGLTHVPIEAWVAHIAAASGVGRAWLEVSWYWRKLLGRCCLLQQACKPMHQQKRIAFKAAKVARRSGPMPGRQTSCRALCSPTALPRWTPLVKLLSFEHPI